MSASWIRKTCTLPAAAERLRVGAIVLISGSKVRALVHPPSISIGYLALSPLLFPNGRLWKRAPPNVVVNYPYAPKPKRNADPSASAISPPNAASKDTVGSCEARSLRNEQRTGLRRHGRQVCRRGWPWRIECGRCNDRVCGRRNDQRRRGCVKPRGGRGRVKRRHDHHHPDITLRSLPRLDSRRRPQTFHGRHAFRAATSGIPRSFRRPFEASTSSGSLVSRPQLLATTSPATTVAACSFRSRARKSSRFPMTGPTAH
jgi:hypothetical protein